MAEPIAILLVGSPRDPTVVHTAAALRASGDCFLVLDTDQYCQHGQVSGSLDDPASLQVHDRSACWNLEHFRSCYARFIDLPTNWGGSIERARIQALQVAISSLHIPVVNRPYAGDSNNSKPYQTYLLKRLGLRVPRSCSTNSAQHASAFIASCPGGAIYKSNSSHRSIVQAVEAEDHSRLGFLKECPVFFQERIRGANVRVHVIDNKCYCVKIRSQEVDYRYDRSAEVVESVHAIPAELASMCVDVTRSLGLVFSGIDFVLSDADGEYYCLEVNPMPGYHGYDLTLNGAISEGLCAFLGSRHALPERRDVRAC